VLAVSPLNLPARAIARLRVVEVMGLWKGNISFEPEQEMNYRPVVEYAPRRVYVPSMPRISSSPSGWQVDPDIRSLGSQLCISFRS